MLMQEEFVGRQITVTPSALGQSRLHSMGEG
jgi:hypothetical protein